MDILVYALSSPFYSNLIKWLRSKLCKTFVSALNVSLTSPDFPRKRQSDFTLSSHQFWQDVSPPASRTTQPSCQYWRLYSKGMNSRHVSQKSTWYNAQKFSQNQISSYKKLSGNLRVKLLKNCWMLGWMFLLEIILVASTRISLNDKFLIDRTGWTFGFKKKRIHMWLIKDEVKGD